MNTVTYTYVRDVATRKGYKLERLNVTKNNGSKSYRLFSHSGPGAYLMEESADLTDILKAVGPFQAN